MLMLVKEENKSILHLGSRDIIIQLRDRILQLHGYTVVSSPTLEDGPHLFQAQPFDLVLIDVEGQGRVPQAEEVCARIRELHPGQKVAFVCNHQVSIDSECPDEIIRAEFNPEAFVEGVRLMLE